MKSLILNPKQALYTEDLTDSATIEGSREIYDEIKNGGTIRNPVYVMQFSEFKNRYAVFNGNRRTRAAELFGTPLRALKIESPRDFQLAQENQPANWHKIYEEDYLRFNGEYFYMDMIQLKKQGLLTCPYLRARKRIKDTIKTFYSWL